MLWPRIILLIERMLVLDTSCVWFNWRFFSFFHTRHSDDGVPFDISLSMDRKTKIYEQRLHTSKQTSGPSKSWLCSIYDVGEIDDGIRYALCDVRCANICVKFHWIIGILLSEFKFINLMTANDNWLTISINYAITYLRIPRAIDRA